MLAEKERVREPAGRNRRTKPTRAPQESSPTVASEAKVARFLASSARRVDRALDRLLPDARTPPRRLHTAIRYAVFPGGKRIRPALTLLAHVASAEKGGRASSERSGMVPALPAACAVELVHSFSLVHDDLPCLDDSPMRRGRPSVHRRFDQATALLAGDALLAFAFETLARASARWPAGTGAAIALELGRAAGSMGMIGGQAAELDLAENPASLAALEAVHRRKTGRLFEAAAVAGGMTGGADRPLLAALRRYARHLGLAFQIADDLLDSGLDERSPRGKSGGTTKDTYPGVLGVGGARRALGAACRSAEREARRFGPVASGLARELALFVAGRQS